MAIESIHRPAYEADHSGLVFVCQRLDVGQPRGVVDGYYTLT
jgi:hypothetical protein